jgi:cysteine desulfurase
VATARAYTKALTLFGNPSAPHREGRAARSALDAARVRIARTLSVKPDELVFTSGGTESNTLAILGTVRAHHISGRAYRSLHVVTSTIEHSSVSAAFSVIAKLGVRVTYVSPNHEGLIDPNDVVSAVISDTVLVSLHHVQSESGTVQRISDIARAVHDKNAKCTVHVDAAQSPLWLEAGPHRLGADLVTYDAQKVQGPKGVGILYRTFSVPLAPIIGGGTQERSVRPGTENVPAIVAAATAFEEAVAGRALRARTVTTLRDSLLHKIKAAFPDARIIGSTKRRVANNVFVGFRDVDGDYLSVLMDTYGVAVTPRSACLGTGGSLSNTTLALTGDESLAKGTIRFSLGPKTTGKDVTRAVLALQKALPLARTR